MEENEAPIRALFETMADEFPNSGVDKILEDDLTQPSSETMAWMWARLMGHQHGTQLGVGGKIPLTREREYRFWPNIVRLSYGDHSFAVPSPAPKGTHYTKAFVLGGSPQEFTDRLMASTGYQPREGNVDEIFVMGGQRLRMDHPGERSVDEIYEMVARYSGVNIDQLRQQSPWLKEEERKEGEGWQQSYATEYELGRLGIEAVFFDEIDWKEYPVSHTYDTNPEAFSGFTSDGAPFFVPPREIATTTYELKDGRQVHMINAKALPRARGIPRPTSDSQTKETVEGTTFTDAESLLFATSLPFVRAGLDGLIRVLSLQGKVQRADITSASWLPDIEALTALGEIPATHKADRRLRAVLQGDNPDAPELTSI